MPDRVTIPASLAAEIAADLAAGGHRAKRWRPAPPDHRFTPVLVLQGADRAGQDAIGHVGEVRGISTVGGYPNVTEVHVLMTGEWFADAIAWAPVGGVDGGPRPDIGDRVLILGCIGRLHEAEVGVVTGHDEDAVQVTWEPRPRSLCAATRWALLPPDAPTKPGQELGNAPGDPTGFREQPTPGETSAPDNPHSDGDMYDLTIRIPMSSFTVAPNEDLSIDKIVDLAMCFFPEADATGAPAWLEDGPPPCPTCGATDRAERRHRAHADAEAALRELVRWLTAERDRLDGYDRRAYAYSLVLDRLRDQGLDVDYLAQPPAKETPDA